MRSYTAFALLLAAAAHAADPHHTLPGAFIVELSESSAATSKRAVEATVHDEFLGQLDKRAGGRFTTKKKYASPIFNGVAVQLHTPEELVDLASIPNVVAVRPIFITSTPKPPLPVRIAAGSDEPATFPLGQGPHIMTGVDKVHAQGFTGKGIKIRSM